MKQHAHRSKLLAFAKFALPLAIIAYLLWRVEPSQWRDIEDQPKHYGLLIAALLVASFALGVSFVRWCILVRCQGIELTMLEAFRLSSIGFLLSFVAPGAVGGDLFKGVFLARRRPGKRLEAVASVLVDRGVGLYALMLLVAIGLWLADPVDQADSELGLEQLKVITWVLFAVATLVLAILVFGGRSVDRCISRWGHRGRIGGLLNRIAPPIRTFHSHPIAFGVAVLMSVVVQGSFAVSIFLIARGLYASTPTLLEHLIIVPLGMLASALPLTPAGVGVFEATIQTLYSVVPAVPTEASGTLVALVFEFVKVLLAVVGTVFYWTANEEVRQSLEEAEEETAERELPGEVALLVKS